MWIDNWGPVTIWGGPVKRDICGESLYAYKPAQLARGEGSRP